MYFFHPRKPMKYIDRILLYSGFWTKIKRKLRKIFNQNYICLFYIEKKFNTSFSTFVRTLFLVSILLPILYFLADLADLYGEVQAEYKCLIKFEIITRCLRSSNKQQLFLTTFFGIKNVFFSLFNPTNSYLF